MSVYLLIVSFILHFITFFILIILTKRLKTFDYEQLQIQKREIEDLLAYYSVELKEENERFLKEIVQTKQIKEKPIDVVEQKETQEVIHDQTVEIDYEPSLEAQALQLYEQGYDIKEIAKTLNKGHGEIELMLKFYHSK